MLFSISVIQPLIGFAAEPLSAEVFTLVLNSPDHFETKELQILHQVQHKEDKPSTLHIYALASEEPVEAGTQSAGAKLVDIRRKLRRIRFSKDSWQEDWQELLPQDIALLQLIKGSANGAAPRLLGYTTGSNASIAELREQPRTFQTLLALPTIYRNKVDELDADISFARDLTGDDREDLLMPDFDGWRFARQKNDGTFDEPIRFGPEPAMGIGSARYVYFTAHEPYVFDHNGDSLDDLAFWQNGALQVYPQTSAGSFASQPVVLSPNIDIESDAFFSLTVGADEDNPDGRQAVLDTIEDLNADGLADLLVYSVTGDGLFGKETRYEIHLGRLSNEGAFSFEQEPSSTVGSGGIQIDVERLDIDGDGQLEMLVTSFDLGLRSIIRALLSRSVNLDLAIYNLENGKYPDKPNVRRQITAKLDLAKGDIFVPAVLLADVDGDGLKDLLLQNGDDELRVYTGTGTTALFTSRPQTVGIKLPRSGGSIEVIDIDGDSQGIDELLIYIPGKEANSDDTDNEALDKAKNKAAEISVVRFNSPKASGDRTKGASGFR